MQLPARTLITEAFAVTCVFLSALIRATSSGGILAASVDTHCVSGNGECSQFCGGSNTSDARLGICDYQDFTKSYNQTSPETSCAAETLATTIQNENVTGRVKLVSQVCGAREEVHRVEDLLADAVALGNVMLARSLRVQRCFDGCSEVLNAELYSYSCLLPTNSSISMRNVMEFTLEAFRPGSGGNAEDDSYVRSLMYVDDCRGSVVLKLHETLGSLDRTPFNGTVALSSLTSLFLPRTGILNVSDSSFRELPSLRLLSLEGNEIEVVAREVFHPLAGNLESLNLENNLIGDLPEDVLWSLRQLTHVNLARNRLESLPANLFFRLNRLREVKVNDNRLREINSDALPTSLTYHIRLCEDCAKNMSDGRTHHSFAFVKYWENQTITVDYSNNINVSVFRGDSSLRAFRELNFVASNCSLPLDSVRNISTYSRMADFKGNNVEAIDMDFLASAAGMSKLDLTSNRIRTVDISWDYPLVQSADRQPSNPQTKVYIQRNPIACDCNLVPFLQFITRSSDPPEGLTRSEVLFNVTGLFCAEPASHRGVQLTRIFASPEWIETFVCEVEDRRCPSNCTCYFVTSLNVTVVNCTNRGLAQFPASLPFETPVILHLERNLISSLPDRTSQVWSVLRELYLDHNAITSVDSLVISPVMRRVTLSHNRMRDIPRVINKLMGSNSTAVTFTLGYNPVECSCDLYNIRSQLLSGNIDDYKDIWCQFGGRRPSEEKKVYLYNATMTDLCPTQPEIMVQFVVPAVSAFVVLVVIFMFVIYRYKEQIKLRLFVRGWCLKLVTEVDIDADKKYDAFVSYSSEDEEWVAKLVTELESGSPPYTLCLHNRDWLGGEWIIEQIHRSVRESRRTIIVLTDSFVKSDWSRLEFQAAYKQSMVDHMNRVLVVVPGEVPDIPQLSSSELRAFVSTNTYIKYEDSSFWTKLRCAMPRIRSKPPAANGPVKLQKL